MRTLFILTFLSAILIGCAPELTLDPNATPASTSEQTVYVPTDGPVASPNPSGQAYSSNVVQLAQPQYTVILFGYTGGSIKHEVYAYIAQGYIIQHQTEGSSGRITFTLIKY